MPNPETHSCCTCGYTWKHGQDGSHSCSKRLREVLSEILDLIEPAVGRFSDGEPINPIGHAYDLGRTVIPKP